MKKILIVEDDHFFCKILSEIIIDQGIKCINAYNVQDALNLDLHDVDAAVIDVMLPNIPELSGIELDETRGNFLSGVALARKIKKKFPQIPIILFSADIAGGEAKQWAREQHVKFVYKNEGPMAIISALKYYGLIKDNIPQAFIVHGHDEKSLLALKNYIQNTLKWKEPIVLREQPSQGKTIIEKFEEYSVNMDYIFVLLTPDDITISPDDHNDQKRRARQNVIFELGFFYGNYGRKSGRILVLYKDKIELPSDIHGIIWIDISKGINAAGETIRKELKLA